MKACKIFNLLFAFHFTKTESIPTRLYCNSVLYHLPNTQNTIGRNIKSCLPDRSKVPDHGKTVFLNHPVWAKNRKIPVKNE